MGGGGVPRLGCVRDGVDRHPWPGRCSMTGRDRVRGEQAAPLPVGSSMPPEVAGRDGPRGRPARPGRPRRCPSGRAAGARPGRAGAARRAGRRHLGLGEEDRPAAARRPAEVLYRVSPRGQRCGCARFRRRGGRDRWARAAPRRRPRVGGGGSTVAARSRPTSPAGAGSTTSRSATNPPPATPSTMTTPPWPGYARRRAWVATWSASADVGRGDGVCEECRADGLGRNSIKLRCAANLDAPVRRGP